MADADSATTTVEPAGSSPWERFAELRGHWIIRFAAAYGVAAWLIIEVSATVLPAFNLPE